MSKFDYFDIDGHLLRMLLAVYEEGSVTRAAQRLGVTQSAVSHLLDKLRGIVGDPLFVKCGRSIVATPSAVLLAERARPLLDELRDFSIRNTFDPSQFNATLTIAANELQRDLLLPPLFRRLREKAPGLKLRVIFSGVPSAEMLRNDHCHLVISPRPPDAIDIVQKRLFNDHYAVFFDKNCRTGPASMEEYLAAEHITVLYEPQRMLEIDEILLREGIDRNMALRVAAFSGIPPFLRDSDYLTTLPSLLGRRLFRHFGMAPVPFPSPTMPMYLIWHVRYRDDPMHVWLRSELEAVVEQVLG